MFLVVLDTETLMIGCSTSNALTSEVLPAPEGAAMTNMEPTAEFKRSKLSYDVDKSFEILHLFTNLLYGEL
jgi:hypothetical protein